MIAAIKPIPDGQRTKTIYTLIKDGKYTEVKFRSMKVPHRT